MSIKVSACLSNIIESKTKLIKIILVTINKLSKLALYFAVACVKGLAVISKFKFNDLFIDSHI